MNEDQPKDGVLAGLPSTRPQRRSPKRDAKRPPRAAAATAAEQPKAPKAARKRIAAQGFDSPAQPRKEVAPPSNTDILVSAVQTAGELAQIGLTVGEHLVRAAARRLKP